MNRSRVTGDLASHGNIFVDIANDRVGIGSTIPGEKLSLPDSAKIALGNSVDLEIFHDSGTLNFIRSNNAKKLVLRSDTFQFGTQDGAHRYIDIPTDEQGVSLFYDNNKKLETINTGVTVTGNVDAGTGGFLLSDGGRIRIGNAQDFELYHDGSHSIINDSAGSLLVRSNIVQISTPAGSKYFKGQSGVAELYHSDSKKFETTSSGASVTGSLDVSDDIDVTDDLTIGGEFGMIGSSDSAKYFDVRTGASNSLHIRSSLGGASNLVTMLSIGRNGSSFVGDLTLGDSSDTSSAAGPIFTLNRNSSSPADADYLGQIKFAGRSDTAVQRNYAKITGKILDASNGTEDGIIEFSHIKAGSQVITGRFRSDSLQLLNSTNFSVAGTSEFTGAATFSEALTLSKDTTDVINFSANSTSDKRGISFNGRTALSSDYNDGYLRLNNENEFTNGVYTPSIMRADGGFRTDSHVVVNSSGFIVASRIAGALPALDGSNLTNVNATTLDSIDSSSFLRSDAADTASGDIGFSGGAGAVTINAGSDIRLANGNWTGNAVAKIQHHNDFLYISGGTSGIIFRENDTNRWSIDGDGHFDPSTDSTYDIGQSDRRVRNGYFDTLYGDGSNLTGITQTTINNNANNRIITGSGTANTLEAESTVTWDGTQFIIRSSDAITSFNGSKALTLQGGDAAGEYVNLAFNGNGYQLGVISGYTYGTNGTGGLVFSTTNSGSINSRMIINQNGHLQPSTDSTYDLGLTGTRWRNVYADTLYGDGSNLTGITQTTINNNANNKIITGSGTANTLEAESKITFDGTNLRIDQGNTSDGLVGQAYAGYFGLKHADQTYGSEYMILSSDNHTYISASSGSSVYIRGGGNSSTNEMVVSTSGTTIGGNLVLTTANEGSGNGIDADTVDGLHSSSFVRNLQNSGHNIQFGSGSNTGHTPSSYAYAIFQEGGSWTHPYPDLRLNYHTGIVMAANASYGGIRFQRDYNNTTELMSIGNGDNHVRVANNLYANGGSTVWNASNDGSGSGLDADTLDGTQANAMIRSGVQSSVSGWHISAYRNGNGTSPHLYFSHSSGYGQHINTYNTSDSIYALEVHSNSKQLLVVYNSGRTIHGGTVYPGSNNSYDLGTTSNRWRNIYSQDLNVIKASGNLSGTFVASSGLGTLEIGGSTGAFIDLKTPSSDDYDMRLGTAGSGGYVTVPSGQSVTFNTYVRQSGLIHFDVKLTSGTTSGDIKFNTVLENVGSHYSTSTGRFTAPVAGVYHFAGTVLQNNSGSQFDVNLRYNNSSNNKGNSMRATFTGHSTIQISETLKLNANDYVHINVSSGALHLDGSGNWCGFQGTLIG